jgi:hypothetical protein
MKSFHNLYSSLNIIRVIKSRRVGLAGHVAYIGKMKNSYKILGILHGSPRHGWEDSGS